MVLQVRGEKRNINLNTLPLRKNKQKLKDHGNFHLRTNGIKIVGKEEDIQECKECHRILPVLAFTVGYLRADGAWYLKKLCRECHTILQEEQREARKNASPKSNDCDNCHRNLKLSIDHIHGTFTSRGWLCKDCNTGIGALGDTLEGLLRAAIFLEKDKSKIIEKLNDLE